MDIDRPIEVEKEKYCRLEFRRGRMVEVQVKKIKKE
jgi:hypothetical protein